MLRSVIDPGHVYCHFVRLMFKYEDRSLAFTASSRRFDLLHFTGQDFTAAQRERAQEDFKVPFKGAPPHPPPHSHTKDSHSTGITLLFSNSAWVLLRPTELSTFKEL